MVDDGAGIVRPTHTKVGRATEVRWTWERIQDERWGRWMILSAQHWSISTAADHREIGGENGRGTFIEPPLPLGGGC